MKKIMLSILALALSALMLLALAACDNGDAENEKTDETTDVVETEAPFQFSEYNGDDLFTNGVTPFKSESGNKIGFIDKTGKYIIAAKYDNAYPFAADGLARVEVGGMWGFINTEGKYVIEPKFGSAEDFDESGMAHVFFEGKHGFIDRSGAWVIENKYVSIGKFADNGLATMCVGSGDEFSYGYIDREGKEVIAAQFEEVSDFAPCGLAWVKKDGLYGFIDKTGAFVIEAKYRNVTDFAANGLAFAALPDNAGTGYINTSGEIVFSLDAKYAYLGYPFDENGLAKVSIKGAPHLVNEKGEIVVDIDDCTKIEDFADNGLALAEKVDYGYINMSGEWVIEPKFSNAYAFKNGYARVKLDGKWGFIDEAGTMVVQPQFDRVTDFGEDGYAIVMQEDEDAGITRYAVIDTSGAFAVNFKTDISFDFGFSSDETE